MRSTTVTRTVDAPVESVWSLATDLERWAAVISGIERIEVLEGDGFAEGTRWRETRRMMGREATEEMWVTEVRPGRSYTTEADGPGVRYVTTLTFEPDGPDRSTVGFTFGARPTGRRGEGVPRGRRWRGSAQRAQGGPQGSRRPGDRGRARLTPRPATGRRWSAAPGCRTWSACRGSRSG